MTSPVEEFAELLAADIAERPASATRTLDVARAGYVWHHGPQATGLGLLHVGRVNEVSTVVLAVSLAVGVEAARTSLRTLRLVRG